MVFAVSRRRRGRPRKFCSDACCQRAARAAWRQRERAAAMTTDDVLAMLASQSWPG
jgi:hypothetical protein